MSGTRRLRSERSPYSSLCPIRSRKQMDRALPGPWLQSSHTLLPEIFRYTAPRAAAPLKLYVQSHLLFTINKNKNYDILRRTYTCYRSARPNAAYRTRVDQLYIQNRWEKNQWNYVRKTSLDDGIFSTFPLTNMYLG